MSTQGTKADKSRSEDLMYDERDSLSPAQITALEVRSAGGSQSDAAQQAGVDQRTVRRWERHNYCYIAESNRKLAVRNSQSADRLREIWDLATQNVVTALKEGDRNVTLAVFKTMIDQPPRYPVGPLNRNEVRRAKVQGLVNETRQDRLDMLEHGSFVGDICDEIADTRDQLATDKF
mgnify:CR=1 FL=1|jgi:hypothetical protein